MRKNYKTILYWLTNILVLIFLYYLVYNYHSEKISEKNKIEQKGSR